MQAQVMNQNALANIEPDDLLQRIANGELLVEISASLGVSHDAVGKKLRKLAPDEYKLARTIGITTNLHKSRRAITEARLARDAVALAGAREEFRADAWFAERECPELYGAKQEITHHAPSGPLINVVLSTNGAALTADSSTTIDNE